MNKEVGEKYDLKYDFIFNCWAAPDLPCLCVTPLGITREHREASMGGFSGGLFTSPCLTTRARMRQDLVHEDQSDLQLLFHSCR